MSDRARDVGLRPQMEAIHRLRAELQDDDLMAWTCPACGLTQWKSDGLDCATCGYDAWPHAPHPAS
jgi:uncharacterized Zn finger protein (UPF0148 family)